MDWGLWGLRGVALEALLRGVPGTVLPVFYRVVPFWCQRTMWAADKSKYMSWASIILIHWNRQLGSFTSKITFFFDREVDYGDFFFLTQITWRMASTFLSLCAKGRLNARKASVTNQNRWWSLNLITEGLSKASRKRKTTHGHFKRA